MKQRLRMSPLRAPLTYFRNLGYSEIKGMETPCRVVGAANAESKFSSFRNPNDYYQRTSNPTSSRSHTGGLGEGMFFFGELCV